MVVVYYTSTNFLDVIIETIRSIKNNVELHVFIEITNASKNTTIIDVKSLEGMNDIETPERLLGQEKWDQLKGYFEGVASVQFVVHKHKMSFSLESVKVARSVGKYLKKYKVDIIHFDTTSPRAIGLYPYIRSKSVFISLHDPVPHSGENNWREKIPEFVFSNMAKGYFFYSNFACQQFHEYYKKITVPKRVLSLQPYSFITRFMHKPAPRQHTILFFGRLSIYKGIDLLLEAIPKVLEKYPNEHFIIAGKPAYNYIIDEEAVEKCKDNVTINPRYLTIEELVKYIEEAKFVVCPYRDATQSGVLMTCFAMGKTVVATNVGSFSEYITDNINGLLAPPDADAIAGKMIEALDNENYCRLQANVTSHYSEENGRKNGETILAAYREALK